MTTYTEGFLTAAATAGKLASVVSMSWGGVRISRRSEPSTRSSRYREWPTWPPRATTGLPAAIPLTRPMSWPSAAPACTTSTPMGTIPAREPMAKSAGAGK